MVFAGANTSVMLHLITVIWRSSNIFTKTDAPGITNVMLMLLDILKYLHENGCPWNEFTRYCAMVNGHLDILQYLHENECPWDDYSM